MIKMKIDSRASRLLLASCLVVVGFQNCAPFEVSSSSSLNSFSECQTGICEVLDLKTVAIDSSETVLTSMLHLAGVNSPSDTTLNTYAAQSTKIPEIGKVDQITAPMWVALTTISSEVCSDLLNQETAQNAQRAIFANVDFARGPASVTPLIQDDVIRRMARSFWSRNETTQEKMMIASGVSEAFAGLSTAADTRNQMLFTCIAMLGSLDAHKF